jgi:hypothetical protein
MKKHIRSASRYIVTGALALIGASTGCVLPDQGQITDSKNGATTTYVFDDEDIVVKKIGGDLEVVATFRDDFKDQQYCKVLKGQLIHNGTRSFNQVCTSFDKVKHPADVQRIAEMRQSLVSRKDELSKSRARATRLGAQTRQQ